MYIISHWQIALLHKSINRGNKQLFLEKLNIETQYDLQNYSTWDRVSLFAWRLKCANWFHRKDHPAVSAHSNHLQLYVSSSTWAVHLSLSEIVQLDFLSLSLFIGQWKDAGLIWTNVILQCCNLNCSKNAQIALGKNGRWKNCFVEISIQRGKVS
jgi:hypothetical protein